MGQIKDYKDSHDQRRSSAKGPKVRLIVCALGLALTLTTVALSQSSQRPPDPPVRQDGAVAPTGFDQKLAWEHLLKQCAFGPRFPGSEAHIKTRDWLLEDLKKNSDNAYLQEFSHKWSKTGQPVKMWNVVAEQGWKDAKTRVLLLAHWDTRPYATEEMDPKKAAQPIVGANDGASGVAVLLEIARVMKTQKPADVGIMYLLTDGEDLGPETDEMFLGAWHFAKNLPSPKPNYGILLDMIGDKDLRIPVEQNSFIAAGPLVRAFYAHAKAVGAEKTFPFEYGQYISDDHLPLIEKGGIPTIDLIDFDYAPWHTLGDTPDKCSPDSLGKVGKVLESWLLKKPAFRMP